MKIFSALFLVLTTLMVSFSAAAQWPPETGAKVAGNALEIPTQLSAVNTSLEQLLNQGGVVISSYAATDGPVVTLRNGKHYIICLVKGAGSSPGQNVPTSKCYQMN